MILRHTALALALLASVAVAPSLTAQTKQPTPQADADSRIDSERGHDAAKATPQGQPEARALPVTTIKATTESLHDSIEVLGEIKSSAVVSLKSKVTGYLDTRHVQDGQSVKKGDVLFTIDERDFVLALDRARAQEQISQAAVNQARIEFNRIKSLNERKAISQQELDVAHAALTMREGELKGAKASVAQQQRQLDEARIVAPFDGIVGIAAVNEGDLIQAQMTELVTVTSMNPLWVEVGVSESQYTRLFDTPDAQVTLAVDLMGEHYTMPVIMQTPQFNPLLGTVTLRAELTDPEGRIKPGMFTRVTAANAVARDRVVVPQMAVLQGQDGPYVLLARNGIAEQALIKTGSWQDGNWIVEQGLAPGDQVITSGHIKLRPGAPVINTSQTTEG